MNVSELNVRERLLEAAKRCFLADEYQNVTTRHIAEQAQTNISMIRYYFVNKEGLFEEMIREILRPLLDAVDNKSTLTEEGFQGFFYFYYKRMLAHPEFPKLIIKVLALNQGPGRQYILQLLESGRSRYLTKANELQKAGLMDVSVDPDIARLAFVSLAMTPMLLKDVFEEQTGREMDDAFLQQLADFNAGLFSSVFKKE